MERAVARGIPIFLDSGRCLQKNWPFSDDFSVFGGTLYFIGPQSGAPSYTSRAPHSKLPSAATEN